MSSPIVTVNDVPPRNQFAADGLTRTYNIPWAVRSADHLLVTFGDGAAPEIAYTVVPVDESAGFLITFDTPPPAGTIITAVRRQPIERQTNYGQQTEFTSASVNAEGADRTLQIQEVASDGRRAVRLLDYDLGPDQLLPKLADRIGKYFKWDERGRPVASNGTADIEIDFNDFPPAGEIGLADLLLLSQAGTTRTLTTALFAAFLRSAVALPVITSGELGLAGDFDFATGTGTDDSAALQKSIDAVSLLAGGGTYFLSADPGKGFLFRGRIRAKTNIRLIFLSPVALGATAGLSIRGDLAAVSDRDGFRLLADGVAGGASLQIDTAPHGGGAPSVFFAADDIVTVAGLLDSAGTPLEEQELTVLSTNDVAGTLIFRETLNASYKVTYPTGGFETGFGTVNRTILRKIRKAALAADAAEGSDVVRVVPGGTAALAIGDVVLCEDDSIQSDLPGASAAGTGRTRREPNRILAMGEGGATNVRLARRLARPLLAARRARLTVIATASGASIEGASCTFAEPASPAGTTPRTFEMRYAFKSEIAGSHVPNEDIYGSRGNAFRVDFCLTCKVTDCLADTPKFFAAGEGYGVYITHSADCSINKCYMIGGRHNYIWFNATDCDAYSCRSSAGQLSDFDFHGGDEVGCVIYDPEVAGGSVSVSSGLTAFSFGNANGMNQPRFCGVQAGTVENYQAAIAQAVRFEAGAVSCFVRGTKFVNINAFVLATDVGGAPNLTSINCEVAECSVDGCADWLVQVLGNSNGSTVRTVQGLKIINNVFRGISRIITARQAAGLRIRGNDFDGISIDPSFTYIFNFLDVTFLSVTENNANGGGRGFSVQTCPAAVIAGNRLQALVNGTLLDDKGGNTALRFIDNIPAGFDPTFGRLTTAGLVEHPRAIALVVPNGAIVRTMPLYPSGAAAIQRQPGVLPRASVAFDTAGGGVSLISSAVPAGAAYAWLAVQGPLTGAEAANTLAVGAATDGTVQIGNKTGASLTLNVMWS